MDAFYVTSSALFLLTFLLAVVADGTEGHASDRSAGVFCLLVFALFVAFLVLCSITVDFGNCFYPSRRGRIFRRDG